MMQTQQRYREIVGRLKSVRRSEQLHEAGRGLATAVTIGAAAMLAMILFEAWMHGTVQLRTAMVLAWIGVTVASLIVLTGPAILRLVGLMQGDTVERMALRVGRAYDDVGDMLCNVLQLVQPATAGTADLASAAFERTVAVAEPKDFSVIVDRRPARWAALWMFLSLALVIGLPLALPSTLGASFQRLAAYDTSFLPPAPYRFVIEPRDTTVMRGTTLRVTAHAIGTPPPSVTIWIRELPNERYQPFTVRADSAGTYHYQMSGLTGSVEWYAQGAWLDDGVMSDTGRITVIDRPLVRTLQGRVSPPSYTMLGPTELTEQQADVTALNGSLVDLSIVSNKELRSASILVMRGGSDSSAADTTRVPMQVRGSSASGRFAVQYTGAYAIVLEDKDGQSNAEPVRYAIVALTDGHPTIALIQPTTDAEVDQRAVLPVTVAIADDYGFSSLKLHYRLVSSKYARPEEKYSSIDLPFTNNGAAIEVPYVWNLGKLGISPEDVYEFYVEVADNDRVRGPKTARTSTMKVRLPSLDEVFAQTDRTQDEAARELKEIAKEAEEVRKEAEQLQREMAKQSQKPAEQVDWKEKKKAEDLLKRQEALEKKMEQVAEKIEQMTEQLQQHNAISPETLQKYMELQKLMQQVKSPELQRMQEQMRKAMEQMSPEELQKAMKDFKFNEEDFKKNIERTMNLLKRTQAEQKADELSKRAEELAQKQDELQQRTENTNAANKEERQRIAEEQKRLQDDLQKLGQETKDLEKLMKELGADMPMDQMDKAQKELNQEETQQQMEQAERDAQKGDMQNARKKQQQASDNLQRFAQQMKNMKRDMKRNSAREAMRQMQRSMNDMLDLSRQQEALRDQTQSLDPNSAQYPQMAQKQQRLQEAMSNIANNMMQLAQKSTSVSQEMAQDMGNSLQNMKDAIQQLQDRNGQMAAKDQSGAMSSMNSAVQRMSDALGQMMQGEGEAQGGQGQNPGMGEGNGQSPFQRLQNLANQQKSINEGSQSMGGSGQPMNDQQRAEMGRLAAQQGKALKAMDELEKERQQINGGKKPIGDLKAIADDMREVMTDMQTGSITSETRMRQERILSRLLNASRSINDRDYEKTRESRAGQDVNRKSPSALDMRLLEGRTQSMRDLLNRLREGYTKDYENLIRLYFEALQKQNVNVGQ